MSKNSLGEVMCDLNTVLKAFSKRRRTAKVGFKAPVKINLGWNR